VRTHRLASTDGFIVFDLEGADMAVGVTRLAPKILLDGAQLLARTNTYAFAAFGLELSGGSAGINAPAEGRDEAVAAYVAEVTPLAAERRWVTDPGAGVTADDLAPLREHDPRPPEVREPAASVELVVNGALAAAEAVAGSLAGKTFRVDGKGPAATRAAKSLAQREATAADEGHVDLLFAAGRAGSIDHERAEDLDAGYVVPLAPAPVTAKAYAVLSRAGCVYLPDFVCLAAPLLAGFDGHRDPVAAVGELAAEVGGAGTAMWKAAVDRAEAFLATWQETLPFGRPLA
jgi:glutamate dehydrogenase/leucine dehydrogenase